MMSQEGRNQKGPYEDGRVWHDCALQQQLSTSGTPQHQLALLAAPGGNMIVYCERL